MSIGARAIITDEIVGKRDMTTIRGVDTTERIFYVSPFWLKELLIRNTGTYDVQIRLSEREKPITVKAGGELNLSGEFAYFLASAGATQNIEILYRPSKKLITKRVPPIGLYFDGIDDYVGLTKTITLANWSLQSLVQVGGVSVAQVSKYQAFVWDATHQIRLAGDGINRFQGWIKDKSNVWRNIGDYYYSIQNVYLPCWTFNDKTDNGKLYVDGELIAQNTISQLVDFSISVLYSAGGTSFYYYGLAFSSNIYNRPLTDREVKHNYNNPYEPVQKGLVLYLSPYSIDIVNSVWYDESGFENHGTIYGAQLKELWRPEQ